MGAHLAGIEARRAEQQLSHSSWHPFRNTQAACKVCLGALSGDVMVVQGHRVTCVAGCSREEMEEKLEGCRSKDTANHRLGFHHS